eukprot:1390444-Karenia_brevis.AAC.1
MLIHATALRRDLTCSQETPTPGPPFFAGMMEDTPAGRLGSGQLPGNIHTAAGPVRTGPVRSHHAPEPSCSSAIMQWCHHA